MKKIVYFFIVAIILILSLLSYAVVNDKKTLYAPSIENVNKVLILNNNEFLVGGNTKSFTETSDDWIFLKFNSDLSVSKLFLISGSFSDKLVDLIRIGDKFLAIGDTWSFRRESLDDVLVVVLDNSLSVERYYVVSGTRDDKCSKIITTSKNNYFLGYTKSVGFGATSALIYKIDKDFYPSSFWVVGSSVDIEPFDLIELTPNKYLLVANYQKIKGNKDCLLAISDDNFNISRAFAFGGGFDENIVDIIKSRDNFYFIFESRSFKPVEKINILISSFNRNSLNHVRSFAFGTLEDEKYLSSYQVGDSIYVFFSTVVDKKPVLGVAVLDTNLRVKGVFNINNLFNIDSRVSAFQKLGSNLWISNIFNVNTLEDITVFKTGENMLDYLSKDKNQKQLESLRTEKYYLKIDKYPNLESYPVELKSQKISNENFVITNEINLNVININFENLWR